MNEDKLKVSEADLASFVEDALDTFGWKWIHQRPAKTEKGWRTALTGDKGFPDYIATREGDIYFIELKSEKAKLRPEQEAWLNELNKNPAVRCFIWRPSQRDEVIEVLR